MLVFGNLTTEEMDKKARPTVIVTQSTGGSFIQFDMIRGCFVAGAGNGVVFEYPLGSLSTGTLPISLTPVQ